MFFKNIYYKNCRSLFLGPFADLEEMTLMARHQGKTQSPGAMRSCSACMPNFNQIYFWISVDS